jgi:hypothetical protein
MKPGDLAVADADVTLTAIWREHDFTYSVSDDDATITASCSHDDCALPDGEISLTIRKPALSVYGDTDKGFEANASLTLNGLDAFIEYCRDLQAFMEYGTEMDAYKQYDKVIEYYKEHPEEYKEYADEIDAYIKELEKLADLADGWADKYIKYYKATKDSDGVYIKKGSALKAPPTAAGDYVAELEIEDEDEDIHKTIFVGYTIDKADPLYDVPEGMSAEFGQRLGEVNFAKDPDGTWEWNEPEKSVTKLDNFRSMATFTPKDPKNYNTLTDVKVPVKVTVTTETNIADKALVDAAKDAVNAARKNPTKETVEAAQAALAKIVTQNQKAMYGQSEFGKDQAAVAEAKKALEEAAKKEANERAEAAKKAVKTVTVNTKTVSAKTLSGAIAKAGGSNKYVTTIVLGKNVKNISKGAFKGFKSTKTLVVQSKKLTKKSVKGSLKGSKVKKIKVKVGNKKTNKKYVKKYRKIFTRKNAGRKASVKR